MTLSLKSNPSSFDVYSVGGAMNVINAYQEKLFGDNWTLDPKVFGYNIDFRPTNYVVGNLAESFEFTDPHTFVVHIRQGIHWQNISPVNGREFTSADVLYHYFRNFGLGSSYTPSPLYSTTAAYQDIVSLTAPDKYTVNFKFKTFLPEFILESLESISTSLDMEPHEAVDQWGNLTDWHHAIGTGPFILSDFVSGSSVTLVKNPTYWAYDGRYPQNQLPYVDTLKLLVITDPATTLAAVRTGKIDFMDGVSLSASQQMAKTNPSILQILTPGSACETIDPRNDKAPFTDIRVRQAMQQAIDLTSIANNYYGGTTLPYPSALTSRFEAGWGWDYPQWPQDIKDQYAYNPTAAKQLLAAAGFPNGFTTTCVVDAAGDLDLIQIVKSYLAAVGITMNVQTMESTSMLVWLNAGKNDALINRIGNGPLGLSYEPSRQINRFATATTVNNYSYGFDPAIETDYENAMAAADVDTVKALLLDVNKIVVQKHFVVSLLIPMNHVLCQPWLKGYNGQARSVIGQGTPLMLGFYTSRFWIDQKLKSSMGY
jgi:peptide/nickel transport system substrate-binding protein